MVHKKLIIIYILLFLVSAGGYAQQTCYQIGLNEGREIFNEAQRLERSGRCIDAVPRFWEALRRFRLARSCRDLPANHELDAREAECIRGITACGGKSNESTFLIASAGSLTFTDQGGERQITVGTNADAWRVDRAPAWCTVRQSDNRLTVICRENTGTDRRSDRLVIVANTLTFEIAIVQEGRTPVETPAHERFRITEATFAGKYADGASGDALYNNMTFLLPQITCDHLVDESKTVKLDYKIVNPNGELLPGTDDGFTFSEEITLRGNLQTNDRISLAEWGDGSGGAFAATGNYTFEIWCAGVKMFAASFEVLPKPILPSERIRITDVKFACKYADGVPRNYGDVLYDNMTALLPRITCDHLSMESATVTLDFKITAPDGKLLAGVADGYTYSEVITLRGELLQDDMIYIAEWRDAAGFTSGTYTFEVWCSGVSLSTTSFEVVKSVQQPRTPAAVTTVPTASKLKIGIGVKAGLNMATVSNNMTGVNFSPALKPDFHAGVFLNLNIGHSEQKPGLFGVQPEVLYSRQGFAVNGKAISFDYITVPLMVKFYVYEGFNIEVGPYFSYLLSVNPATTVIAGNKLRLSDLKGGKDVGVAAGIGYESAIGLVAGARYLYGMSDMAGNVAWKNQVIAVSIGWKF